MFLRSILAVPAIVATSCLLAGSAPAQTNISGLLSDATTGPLLAGTVYHATGSLTVSTTLTIQPGVIVKFVNAGSTFDVGGTLLCQGTAANPVIFTDIKDDSAGGDTNGDGPSVGVAGHWIYLRFYSTASASVLDHLDVRYAGGFGWSAVTLSGGNITMRDCVVRNSATTGLDLGNGSSPTVERCHFANNASVAVTNVRWSDLGAFSQCTASGNLGGNYQLVASGAVTSGSIAVTKDDLIGNVVVVGSGGSISPGASLTFGPGVIVKQAVSGGTWEVQGTLLCQGTVAEPVIFTSIKDDSAGGDTNLDGPSNGAPGDWVYVRCYAGASASVLDHAEIRYAGNFGWAGLVLNGSDATLRDCVVRDSLGHGLDLLFASAPIIERCDFRDNGGAAVIDAYFANISGFSQCTASGNAGGNYQVFPGQGVLGNVVVQTDDLIGNVAVMSGTLGVAAADSLTLGPGVIVKLKSNLSFELSGGFSTQGTDAAPVVITSFRDDEHGGDTNLDGPSTGAPADWVYIRMYSSGAPTSIEHLLVRYAGGAGWPGIIQQGSGYTLADVRVEHCAAGGFELQAHGGTARGLIAWKCAGYGIDLPSGAFDVRQVTVVDCGTGIHRAAAYTGSVLDTISVHNTTANTSNFAAGSWRYSNGDAALAGGTGNISLDPLFVDELAGDFRLRYTSPCVDTGDPLSPLDLDGTRADMGAVPVDQFDPIVYCASTPNSCGTLPSIGWSGDMRAGATSGFVVRATNTRATKLGVLMYGITGPTSTPFRGGVMCIQPPVKRTVMVTDSVGTLGSCNGVLSIDFASFATGALGGHPAPSLQTPGTIVWCQYLARDNVVDGQLLSDALSFIVKP